MATIMPASELVRRAAAWLAEQRALYPEKSLAALLDEAGHEVLGVLSEQAVDFVEQVVDLAHVRDDVGGGEGQFLLLLGCGGFGLLCADAFAAHGSLLEVG